MMNFSPTSMILAFVFGFVGFLAWRYGRRKCSTRHTYIAIGLMGFPYLITATWAMLLVGAVLITLLFWP